MLALEGLVEGMAGPLDPEVIEVDSHD